MSETLTELDHAKGIRDGYEQSGSRVGNMWLYAMRITGTGAAYRIGHEEYVWRDPAAYLTKDFLDRCNGLSVIFEHPDKNILDSKEFGERVVGMIVLPYLKDDEVWGVAKIYDEDVVDLLKTKRMSTSPAVILSDGDDNKKISLDDGSKLLIEGKPRHLDHLAICEQGVWDKGGKPQGINHGVSEVTEEEKLEAEKKAKADAEMPSWAKGIADSVGALCSRMDAWDKEKTDAAAAKADADKSEEEKAKEEKEKADKAKADEDMKREEQAKVDSAALKAKMDAMEAKTAERSDEDTAAMADAQSRCDSVASAFGKTARAPMAGESPIAYRRRLAKEYQSFSPRWKEIDLALLPDAALANAERDIYADSAVAARQPGNVPAGELREIKRKDASGRQISEFYGEPVWLNAFKPPVRMRLTGLRTPNKGA